MKKLQKYLVDTLTLSSDTKLTLGKKRLSTTAVQCMRKLIIRLNSKSSVCYCIRTMYEYYLHSKGKQR